MFSQVAVHDLESVDLEKLKNVTTIFVVDNKSRFEDIASEVWTFNKFKIMSTIEYKLSNINEDHAVFIKKSNSNTMNSSFNGNVAIDVFNRSYYEYFYYYKKKKKKKKFKRKKVSRVYFSGRYNFGYLKNRLTLVNKQLTEGKEFGMYSNQENLERLKELKDKTLYVSSDINRAAAKHKDPVNIEDVFKNYPYQYLLMRESDLQSKILYAKKSFYYLKFTTAAKEKFVEVIDGYTGDIIYRKYTPGSVKLTSKNIEDLISKFK